MNRNYKYYIINQTKTNYNLPYNHYYPYGMLVPTRNYSNPVYRYGFQAQEKDDEIKGVGNSINYKFRMYDPKIFYTTSDTKITCSGRVIESLAEHFNYEVDYFKRFYASGKERIKYR